MSTGKYTVEFVLTHPTDKRRYDSFWRHVSGFYSLAIPWLAALTPDEFHVRVVDPVVQPISFDTDANIIALSFMTSHATNAYSIADRFRNMGKTVFVGGIHATALPEEAKQHADAVAIGEGDLIWPKMLKDFAEGRLEPFYKADKLATLEALPVPRRDLMPRFSRHIGMASIQTTRGCPYDCTFCSITSVFGRQFRKRPIAEVIQEIEALDQNLIIMVDDNIVADPDYAARFFQALTPLRKRWLSQSDISIAKNEELLELAARSGCVGLLIGLESIHQCDLEAVGKRQNNAAEYESLLRNIHKHRIMTSGSFIFGLDNQGPGIFEETINFTRRVGLAYAFMPILTPYPGTEMFRGFESEGRILHRNWAEYDGSHVVFEPRGMSPDQLIAGWDWATKEFGSIQSILQRVKVAPVQLKYNLTLNMVQSFLSRTDAVNRRTVWAAQTG